MVELGVDERKKMMLEMLEEIDSFCREKGIIYYLTGGTLLGAIRHNGYIPWDDDIDIALKRPDYERLYKEFNSKSGNVEIVDYRNRKHYIWPSAKIINNKTVLIENDVKKAEIGLCLDMFPLDKICGSYDHAKQFVKKVWRWRYILGLKYMKVSNKRSLPKNIVVVLSKVFYLLPDKLIIKRIEKLSRKEEDMDDYTYLCNFAGAWGTREIIDQTVYSEVMDHVFEKKLFLIPKGYDQMLRTVYGDYMQFPPEEKRVSTHTAVVYLK